MREKFEKVIQMRNLEEILRLMELKRQLLRGIEDATQEMLVCREEELPEQVKTRQRFLDELVRQDEALRALCEKEPEGRAVLAAAQGKAEELSEELEEVFAAGQQQRAVLSRLRESETQAMRRLELEKERLLGKIKNTNQGSAAKAARFYSAGTGRTGSSRLGRA